MRIQVLPDIAEAKLAELEAEAFKDGQLQVMPASFYREFSQPELSLFCVRHGLYCLPTKELVNFLFHHIGCEPAIEIGSGNGVIGRALGIPRTDSKMQERPDIAAHYRSLKQAPVIYGADVEKMTALQAVEHYKPKVVVAAWVTHKYDEKEHWRGGNQWGVDEEKLLAKKFLKTYIHVGNVSVHRAKKILSKEHEEFRPDRLFSRSAQATDIVIWIWRR